MKNDDVISKNIFTNEEHIVNDISSDISDLLDVSIKTSSIVDNGIHINNISDIFEYLNNVIPLIQKSNISNNNKLFLSLEKTCKELLENKIINANLNNLDLITAPLLTILSDILKQLKEDKKLDINIPESSIHIAPTPVTIEAPIVNIPAPVINLPKVDAPIVNVDSPVVNIDLDKLIATLEEYLKPLLYNTEINPLAVRLSDGEKFIDELKVLTDKVAEKISYTPNSMFIKNSGTGIINPATEESLIQIAGNMAMQVDDVSTASVTYIGTAPIGTPTSSNGWRIKKIDESGSPVTTTITWAGNGLFNQSWNNRTSLTYT